MITNEIKKEALRLMEDYPMFGHRIIPLEYQFGLWLERHFNYERKLSIPWQELHALVREYFDRGGTITLEI